LFYIVSFGGIGGLFGSDGAAGGGVIIIAGLLVSDRREVAWVEKVFSVGFASRWFVELFAVVVLVFWGLVLGF